MYRIPPMYPSAPPAASYGAIDQSSLSFKILVPPLSRHISMTALSTWCQNDFFPQKSPLPSCHLLRTNPHPSLSHAVLTLFLAPNLKEEVGKEKRAQERGKEKVWRNIEKRGRMCTIQPPLNISRFYSQVVFLISKTSPGILWFHPSLNFHS